MVEANYKDYCSKCAIRAELGGVPTKDNVNCPVGRKSAPKGFQAGVNVLRNGGKLCSNFPGRSMAYIEANIGHNLGVRKQVNS